MKKLFTSTFAFAFLLNLSAKNTTPTSAKISFTENKGQIHDQNYKPRPDVLYGVMADNMAVHIKRTGVSYQLFRVDKWKEVIDEKTKENWKEIDQQTIYRIDLNWLNANDNFTQTHDEELPGYNNYYLESCPNGALNVKSYKGIYLQNLYNGINLHYYQKKEQLKYDYIVAPHANYKLIKIEVKGANISVNKNGSLLLTTPLGKIEEGAPIVFQNGKQLNAKWKIKNNTLSFDIENYNPNYELIIDPVTRMWGTYYGGGNVDQVRSLSYDASGNVFSTGLTVSGTTTLIATVGSHQTNYGGGTYDAFLVKFNQAGVRQWGTYYGGSNDDRAHSCAVDPSGDVYMTGLTASNTGTVIATAGSHQSSHNGGTYDAFLVKFNTNGVRQWGTYYGGAGGDIGHFCSADNLGNIYVTGQTGTTAGTTIATALSHQPAFGGLADAFLVKFNSAGVRQWGTYYGGTASEIGRSCSIDASGNVYLAGQTASNTGTIIATLGSHQPSYGGGGSDAFITKFNSSGTRLWGTYYGGTSDDIGYDCSIDNTGSVIIVGETNGSTNLSTIGAHQLTFAGFVDGFVAKFNSSGVISWGTYYGGTGQEVIYGCCSDNIGNLYFTGYSSTLTGTAIANLGSYQPNHGGGGTQDAFLTKLDNNGVRIWGSYYGGSLADFGYSCKVDNSSNIYLGGYTASNSGTVIASAGSHQSILSGMDDGFLVRFSDCSQPASPTNTTPVLNQTICNNNVANLFATSSGTITWYATPTSTIALGTGTNYITPNLTVGTYTYYAEAATCTVSASRTPITVTVNPSPSITVNSGTICTGKSFTITPSGANTYTFQGGNAVVSPTASTSYTVIGTNTLGCNSNIVTSNVTVNPLPTVTAASNSSILCPGQSATLTASGANTYTWNPGGASTSIVVSPTTNATYTVFGIDANGCQNTTSFTQSVSACTGIVTQNISENEIQIFPNPTNGEIFIKAIYDSETIHIYNMLGQDIAFSYISFQEGLKLKIEQPKGIYFIRIATSIKKIIKQ